ncbi:MAG: biotin-dependent carboxyltransferase [Planctomycetes bacterium]|nr:biotin-dependent carboxyltransferase [Planctomycetota bacterium]
MSLTVLEPGLASRIVDAGRPRTRSLGVSVGGAADRRSLALGNALVGNPSDAAALEIPLKGPRLRAEADVGCVIFGAPFDVHTDSDRIEVGRTFTLRAGEHLHIGVTSVGVHAYLCVRGGFDAPAVLASRSALDTVRRNDTLPCAASTIRTRFCPEVMPKFPDAWCVAATPGLQASWFDEAEFFDQPFTVTPASNRMGLRLKGDALTMPDREMISEAVCPGSVQVTRDGQCIVLGVDGQTIGGYPKIAQVVQTDLDALGQLRPGQGIRFTKITLDEAIERNRRAHAELRAWTMRLRLSLEAFRS